MIFSGIKPSSDNPDLQKIIDLTAEIVEALGGMLTGHPKGMVFDAMLNVTCASLLQDTTMAEAAEILGDMRETIQELENRLPGASDELLASLGIHR